MVGEELELFCAAARLGPAREREVFVAVAARCPMDGDVTPSFFGDQLLEPGAASEAEEGADGEAFGGEISDEEIDDEEISDEEIDDGEAEIARQLLADPAVPARVLETAEARLAREAAMHLDLSGSEA